MSTSAARIEKAAGLIDQVTYTTSPRLFHVKGYRIRLYAEASEWTCTCAWGERHSWELNNECSHALAARYYANEHDIDLASVLPPFDIDNDNDPFAGL